jgi:tetratricopeptide (TPR) repeat protein
MSKYVIVLLFLLIAAAALSRQGLCSEGRDLLQQGMDSLARCDFASAERSFVDSYRSAEKEGDSQVMSRSLGMLGDLHAYFSSYDSAKSFYQKAQGCAKNDGRQSASLSFSLGAAQWMSGSWKDSLAYFDTVLREPDGITPPEMKVRALLFEGSALTSLKEHGRAESCLARALRILERQDSPFLASFANMLLGNVYRERSETQRALICYQSALRGAREHLDGDHYLYSQIYYQMGVFFERFGGSTDDIDAPSCFRRSFEAMMCCDGHLTFSERLLVPHINLDSGKRLTALLIEEGNDEEALRTCQRSKEWQYIERNRLELPYDSLADGAPLLGRAAAVRKACEQKAAEARSAVKGAARDGLRKEVKDGNDEYAKTAAELLESSPYLGSLVMPLSITQQDLLYSLSRDDGFVEFCSIGRRIHGWYVDLTGFMSWEVPPFAVDALMQHGKLNVQGEPGKGSAAQKALTQSALFGPALPSLSSKKRIIISPDMPFFSYPFAALRDEAGAPLAAKSQVQLCVSSPLWTLRTVKRYSAKRSFLLCTVGDKGLQNCREIRDREPLDYSRSALLSDSAAPKPALPSDSSLADAEAALFYPLFSPRVAVRDGDATQARVDEALKDAAIVHFSTYGSSDGNIPSLSGLGLCDSILSASHLYAAKLPPAHVVLSLYGDYGPDMSDEGFYSIGRAFIFAGARSVIVNTRMPEKDIHTALLSDYYKAVKSGLGEGEAFATAQRRSVEAHPGSDGWSSTLFIGRRYDDN